MMLFILFLVQFVIVRSCYYCCNCGALWPIDPYVTVGGSLELRCNLTESTPNVNSSDLYFEYNHNIPLPRENMQIVDNQTVNYIQHNITLKDNGTYSCKIRGRSHREAYVESQVVTVDYPIQNVTNFSCVVHNWDRELTCSWNLGKYLDSSQISVYLKGCNNIADGICRAWHGCYYLNKTYGQWIRKSAVIDVSIWGFHMNVTDKRSGLWNVQQFYHRTGDIVKPDPPARMEFPTITSRELMIRWTDNRPHRDKIFKVQYWSQRDNVPKVILSNCSPSTDASHCLKALDNLTPFTRYQVEVRTRPVSKDGNQIGFWSDPVSGNFVTKEDVPSEAPKLVSYEYQACQRGETSRRISLYWTGVPEVKRNGIITNYVVRVSDNGSKPRQNFPTLNGTMLYNGIISVVCSEGSEISVSMGTRIGLSVESEPLYIPPVTDGVYPPHFVVEASNITSHKTSLDVYWSNIPQAQGYLLVWCINRCQGEEMQTRKIGGNVTSASLQDVDRNIQIGFVYKDSGFRWKHCFYSKATEPQDPHRVSVSQVKDLIQVKWMVRNCHPDYGYSEFFRIEWCKMEGKTCQGDWSHEIIPASEPFNYFIPNLEKDYEYGVRVSSLTRDYPGTVSQKESQPSPVQTVFLKFPGLQAAEISGIVMGCLFVFALLLAFFVCVVRHCKRRIEKVLADTGVDVPKLTPPGKLAYLTTDYGNGRSSMEDYSSLSSPDSCPGDPLLKYRHNGSSSGNPKFCNQISQDSGRGSLQSDQCRGSLQSDQCNVSPVEQKPVPELPLASVFPDYCKFGVHDGAPSSDSQSYRSVGVNSSTSGAYTSIGEKDSSSTDLDNSNAFSSSFGNHLETVRETDVSDTEDEHGNSSDVSSYAKFGVNCSSNAQNTHPSNSSRNPEITLNEESTSVFPKVPKSDTKEDKNTPKEMHTASFEEASIKESHKEQTVSFGFVTDIETEKSLSVDDVKFEKSQVKDTPCINYEGTDREKVPADNSELIADDAPDSSCNHDNSAPDGGCHHSASTVVDSSSGMSISTSAMYPNYVDVNCSSGSISEASSFYPSSSSGYEA